MTDFEAKQRFKERFEALTGWRLMPRVIQVTLRIGEDAHYLVPDFYCKENRTFYVVCKEQSISEAVFEDLKAASEKFPTLNIQAISPKFRAEEILRSPTSGTDVGGKLRHAMNRHDLSVYRVAKLANLSISTVNGVVRGTTENPHIKTELRLLNLIEELDRCALKD